MKRSELKRIIKEVIMENSISNFVAFRDPTTKKWEFYQLGLNPQYKDFYINLNDKNKSNGFEKKIVEKYRHNFIFGNTVEELKTLVQRKNDDEKRREKDENDDIISCPHCGHEFKI